MELLVAEETVGYGTCLEVDSTSPRYLNLVPLMHQIRTDSDFSPRCAAPRRTGSSARIPARYRQEMSLGGDRYRLRRRPVPARCSYACLPYGRYSLGSGAVADSACTMMPVTRQPPASLIA